MRVVVDNGPGKGRRTGAPKRLRATTPVTTLRAATPEDAPALHALIVSHTEEGRLLPRTLGELAAHAHRFVVAVRANAIVGCAELAPLSATVAEVRSLVVSRDARKSGLGLRMVDELGRRARRQGFTQLSAFAHDPRFFVGLGFSIVPHTWVPEKIAHDCHSCALFRNCGQYAIVLDLQRAQALAGMGAAAAQHRG
jgi:N-acetylglutamate synthase-like GNAT family acetyltransferase